VSVSDRALIVDAPTIVRGKVEIPRGSIRKVIVDDGIRWGYVSGVCRFPAYDVRRDGSGSGALIGPLWSQASSLMPPACPVMGLDPVPRQAPNVALIFDPPISNLSLRGRNAAAPRPPASVAVLLLSVEHPGVARDLLASKLEVGDVDHDDLAYLGGANNASQTGDGASVSSA